MKQQPRERAIILGEYILEQQATVRAAAEWFGISKSTVHKDVSERLPDLDPHLYAGVKMILEKNKQERHIRGNQKKICSAGTAERTAKTRTLLPSGSRNACTQGFLHTGITTRKRQQVCAHLHRFSVCRFRAMTDRIYGKAAVPSAFRLHFCHHSSPTSAVRTAIAILYAKTAEM